MMMPKLTTKYKYMQTSQTVKMFFIMNMLIVIIMLMFHHSFGEKISINCIDECKCYMDISTYRVSVNCRRLTARQVHQMRISEQWIRRSIDSIVFSEISEQTCVAVKYWISSNHLQRVARLPENCFAR